MSDLVVFAKNKTQMMESQNQLIEWASGKLAEAAANFEEISVNLKLAKNNGWKLSGWQNQKRIARRKVEFYEKIHAALCAGYIIVPDFPIDIFAVRTEREYPIARYTTSQYPWDNTNRTQRSESLSIGEGRYVDSQPSEMYQKSTAKDGGGKDVVAYKHWAAEFKDIDFPIKAVKPAILEETSKALALKIFDEIGCNPGRKSWNQQQRAVRIGGDPMVIGRVIYRQSGDSLQNVRGETKTVSFLIAWWLKASDIEV